MNKDKLRFFRKKQERQSKEIARKPTASDADRLEAESHLAAIESKTVQKATPRIQKAVEKALGPNPSLAKLSNMIRGMIGAAGTAEVGRRVVEWIQKDIDYAIKQNHGNYERSRNQIDSEIESAMATPEYTALLADLGLSRETLETLRDESLSRLKETQTV